MTLREMFSRIARLLYVPRCVACGERLPNEGGALCPACLAAYELEKTLGCPYCGNAFSECLCATEALKRARVPSVIKLFQYHPRNSRAVQNRLLFIVKRRGLAEAVDFLADELSRVLLPHLPEDRTAVVLTFAPRSSRAHARYGFDHMELLGRAVAAKLGIRFEALLSRRDGREQKRMATRAERFANMKKAFSAKASVDLENAGIILIDDVTTSGATLTAAVGALRAAGYRDISVAVLGCTLLKR